VQQFFKNAAEVKGEEPLSSPAGDETPRAILPAHGEEGEKSDSFLREGEQDRPPLELVFIEHYVRLFGKI
jgi:hypothetical protein